MLFALVERWKDRAQTLRDYGAQEDAAQLWERAAAEMEAALTLFADEDLSLAEGGRETGYSADHLGREVRTGRIENVGRKNAPRIRRGDLPYKAGRLRGRLVPDEVRQRSRAQIARSIVDAHKERNDG